MKYIADIVGRARTTVMREYESRQQQRRKKSSAVIAVLIFALIGIFILSRTHQVLSTPTPQSASLSAQRTVSFSTDDGAMISALEYGSGPRAVLLVHGGQFNKESWAPQVPAFRAAGYRVMAIDLRGFGKSAGPGDKDIYSAPLQLDVLASVRYLRKTGATWVGIVGGSMGGAAAGDAATESKPGEINRVVMLGAAPDEPADRLKCPALFIVARDDSDGAIPRLQGIQAQYDKAPEPKKLVVLDGSAHAQFLFQTNQSQRVMREILEFLAAT